MTETLQQTALFKHYLTDTYSWNEMLGEDGNLRPHWQTFFQSFLQLESADIQDRSQDILRLLKENGVTYNIYSDPSGFKRPWNLDIIPFLISRKEWETIESGLVQRAEVFNLILKDIYSGENKLIKNNLLPPELIFYHKGFLRQCVGIKDIRKHSLILYSADMARSPDGKIWILSDRTQAPSGSGYALENRMAMANVLPELFNGLEVRHLTSYFDRLSDSLQDMTPVQKENPRIVILTPGPGNETYFEHSFLSSYLGFTLVQGDDLMVKDNCVWLKTIGGLEKVDVILRRVDDVYCDPLELKEDSQLGVPGLLQAVRSGNVSIANPLGSSILENPGLVPFLQNICRYFFNEDLIMPAVASWWCGQPKEMQYVLENIRSLVIKRIYRESAIPTSIDAAELSDAKLAALKAQIKAQPYLYVAQEKVAFSSTPALFNDKIEPHNALFRSFLVSHNDQYKVMAGGLTRTAPSAGNFVISNQLGFASKDTWIISPEPGNSFTTRQEVIKTTVAVNKGALPSHTAENLFWVGRYAERVLGNARFHRTVLKFMAEANKLSPENHVVTEQILLKALTHYSYTYPGFIGEDSEVKLEHPWKELHNIMFDAGRMGSMSSNFALFSRSVYAVRDRWSTDTWRVMRNMEEEWVAATKQNLSHFRVLHVLDTFITSMVAFIGLNRESISRDQGWTLLDTGRKIEQSMLLINVLRATMVNKYNDQEAYHLQEAVLKSNENLVNYRYKYRAHIQLPLVLDLLLLDPNNPRSLIYQLDRLKAYLSSLPKDPLSYGTPEHERLIVEAHALLKLADKDELAFPNNQQSVYLNLDNFLSKIYAQLSAITDAISKKYFKHAQQQKQLFSADAF
jgi:uncharacterized circularly permuted ATP-grasp superfamily protein/uncharacterized alpha-E superfamily protein